MSRITNPDTEQHLYCGFFNSLGSDRKYDATDFTTLFDGMVTDGVFASIGDAFVVKAYSGNTVKVGTGKCWFNHTYTWNKESYLLTCDDSESLLNRIDAIVVEIDATDTVRDNFIKVVKGTPASNPARPTLINTEYKHQYALCYIYRTAGSTEISQSSITNMVGTADTPFITAILQTVSLDELLGQWRAQLDEFVEKIELDIEAFIAANEKEYDDSIAAKEKAADDSIAAKETEFDNAIAAKEDEHDAWSAEIRSEMESLLSEVNLWYNSTNATIDEYLADMRGKLADDPATSLQLQIDENEIRNALANGFTDGNKVISEDNSVVTSTNSDGWTLVKTYTNEFATSTTILTDANGTELGRLVKNISSDGLTITSEITLL